MKIKEFKETIKFLKTQLKNLNIKVGTPERIKMDELIVYKVSITSPTNYLVKLDGGPSTFKREYNFSLKALTKKEILDVFEDTVTMIGNSFIYIPEGNCVSKN